MRIDCQSHVFPRAYIDVLAQNPYPPQVVQRGSDFVITYGDVQQFQLREEMYAPETFGRSAAQRVIVD